MENYSGLTEQDLRRLAQVLAFTLQPGDAIALEGDLGAGKTTFARAMIEALSGAEGLEIPSPTFTLVQSYKTPRFDVAHFDLYRLSAPEDLDELGLDPALETGVAIIEWPERAGERLPDERWTLTFFEEDDSALRNVRLQATPAFEKRFARLRDIQSFLRAHTWDESGARLSYLQGDASARRYARVRKADGRKAILMDSPRHPDGPPVRGGLPYSRIAHLAEDVRPFVAIADALRIGGFSTPHILAHDLDKGLLLIEDLGDHVFGREISLGGDQKALWTRGVDTLVALAAFPPPAAMPLPDGTTYTLPPMDHGALRIETELLLDWYWPALNGKPASQELREEFNRLWDGVFARIDAGPKGWALRDYHSPNLIALDERTPPRDVGIIDFQDALLGSRAYDLASLLQDARLDVPAPLEVDLLARYIAHAGANDPSFDAEDFRFSYAALCAQRNTKILGIFARLAKRDGKPQYLAHIPRLWGYLDRAFAHKGLAALKAWYAAHFPPAARAKALDI